MNRVVVADSNIFISAFLRGGKPLELLELARAGQIELAVSTPILEETARVLATKFKVPEDDILAFYEELRGFTKRVEPPETLDVVPGDKTDSRIIECAVAAKSDVIVTGDSHLLDLGEFRGIKTQRVAAFLAGFHRRSR